MDARSDVTPPPVDETPAVPSLPVQRWRLVLARGADAPPITARELADQWEDGLAASDLPFVRSVGRQRARLAFAAPLPTAMTAQAELADLILAERWPVWRVREALERAMPPGWRLTELYDVWLGAPSLPAKLLAADYRIGLSGATSEVVADACRALLAAEHVPRERPKGTTTVAYDLRPLVDDVSVIANGRPVGGADVVKIRARTRFDPALGTGRPEEVVLALGELTGTPLTIESIVRERLILADED